MGSIDVTMLIQAMICPADILLLFLLNKSNPQNPGEPRGFSSWGPHSPGLRFSGELQTLRFVHDFWVIFDWSADPIFLKAGI